MHTTPVSLLIRLTRPGAEAAWQRFVEFYTPLLFYWARQAGLRSPEQARGDSVGPPSDLFSRRVVLYRLTTGQTPFHGRNTLAVLTALATAAPRPVSELNPELPPVFADLITRLLAKNADERFDSAEAVAEAIRAIEQESPESEVQKVQSPKSEVGRPGPGSLPPPRRRRCSWRASW